jgi:curved DNA-binding protein
LLLSPWEASLGPWLVVRTPSGQAEVKIPTPWKAGRTIRLKGHGIPASSAPGSSAQGAAAPGDLFLELAVALPHADSPAAKEAYAALASAFPHFMPPGR